MWSIGDPYLAKLFYGSGYLWIHKLLFWVEAINGVSALCEMEADFGILSMSKLKSSYRQILTISKRKSIYIV